MLVDSEIASHFAIATADHIPVAIAVSPHLSSLDKRLMWIAIPVQPDFPGFFVKAESNPKCTLGIHRIVGVPAPRLTSGLPAVEAFLPAKNRPHIVELIGFVIIELTVDVEAFNVDDVEIGDRIVSFLTVIENLFAGCEVNHKLIFRWRNY